MDELTKREKEAMEKLSKESFEVPGLEEKILQKLEQNKLISTKKIDRQMNKLIISFTAVIAILLAIYFMGKQKIAEVEPISIAENYEGLIQKMTYLYDQFNQPFDQNSLKEELTIIYIPGSHDPFHKIYDKHKGKKTLENVQFIGGFKEMMKGWDTSKKKGHLQEAFRVRYGKDHFSVLLDLESEIAALLSMDGYAIIKVSPIDGTLISKKIYGFDRVAFFKDLKKYFVL